MTLSLYKNYKNQQAFTLIELLATVVIIVVTLTIGIANYLRFLSKQRLYQAGSNIESILKDARIKAQNGYLGSDEIGFCNKLSAVEVSSALTVDNLISITSKLQCQNGSSLTYNSYVVSESNSLLTPNFSILFLPLRGATVTLGSSNVASGSATLTHDDDNIIFNFDQGGSIDVKYE